MIKRFIFSPTAASSSSFSLLPAFFFSSAITPLPVFQQQSIVTTTKTTITPTPTKNLHLEILENCQQILDKNDSHYGNNEIREENKITTTMPSQFIPDQFALLVSQTFDINTNDQQKNEQEGGERILNLLSVILSLAFRSFELRKNLLDRSVNQQFVNSCVGLLLVVGEEETLLMIEKAKQILSPEAKSVLVDILLSNSTSTNRSGEEVLQLCSGLLINVVEQVCSSSSSTSNSSSSSSLVVAEENEMELLVRLLRLCFQCEKKVRPEVSSTYRSLFDRILRNIQLRCEKYHYHQRTSATSTTTKIANKKGKEGKAGMLTSKNALEVVCLLGSNKNRRFPDFTRLLFRQSVSYLEKKTNNSRLCLDALKACVSLWEFPSFFCKTLLSSLARLVLVPNNNNNNNRSNNNSNSSSKTNQQNRKREVAPPAGGFSAKQLHDVCLCLNLMAGRDPLTRSKLKSETLAEFSPQLRQLAAAIETRSRQVKLSKREARVVVVFLTKSGAKSSRGVLSAVV